MQWVEYSPACRNSWFQSLVLNKLGMMAQSHNHSILKVKAGESEFKVMLGYILGWKLAWATEEPSSNVEENNKNK